MICEGHDNTPASNFVLFVGNANYAHPQGPSGSLPLVGLSYAGAEAP